MARSKIEYYVCHSLLNLSLTKSQTVSDSEV